MKTIKEGFFLFPNSQYLGKSLGRTGLSIVKHGGDLGLPRANLDLILFVLHHQQVRNDHQPHLSALIQWSLPNQHQNPQLQSQLDLPLNIKNEIKHYNPFQEQADYNVLHKVS